MRFLRDAVITVVLFGAVAGVSVIAMVRNGGLSASDEPNRLERAVANGSSGSQFLRMRSINTIRSQRRLSRGGPRVSTIWIIVLCVMAATVGKQNLAGTCILPFLISQATRSRPEAMVLSITSFKTVFAGPACRHGRPNTHPKTRGGWYRSSVRLRR